MGILVITGTGTGVGRRSSPPPWPAAPEWPVRTSPSAKPVQTGTADGDDDLAEIGRLSGVRTLIGVARYPAPWHRWPLRRRQDCPCRRSPESSLPCGISMPGRLTLVEGAGGPRGVGGRWGDPCGISRWSWVRPF